MRGQKREAPEVCPVCGADVPGRALACPECGADARSGWGDDTADGIDCGDDTFDYDDFIRREFGNAPQRSGLHPVWWITAVVLLAAFILWAATG